jgi:ATP-binding cassette subfamily B multidrug efflux pump
VAKKATRANIQVFPGPGGHRPGGGMGPGRHFQGPKERAKNALGTVGRLWQYIRRQRGGMILVSLMVLVTVVLNLAGPYLLGVAIDTCIVRTVDIRALAVLVALMLSLYAAAALAVWIQQYIVVGVSQRVIRDLREDLFGKLQTLAIRFFDANPHGELMSRLTNDIENINTTLSMSIIEIMTSALMVLGVIIMMFALNWRLALTALLTIPLIYLITKQVATRTRKGFQDQQKHLGSLNGIIEETIAGHRAIKVFCHENETINEFCSVNQELRRSSVHAQVFIGFMGPLMNMTNNIGFAVVAFAGGWMAITGIATVGILASFLTYTRRFYRPLNQIAQLYNTIQSALAGAERVFETMDERPEITDRRGAPPLGKVRGEVVFDHVTFGYEKGIHVLKDVSFRAEPGETIALVGPTGAGKTTIVNLLTRFYDIEGGSIRIDRKDIRGVQRDSLRRNLGIVLQDTFLFADTVKENIRYGRIETTDEEIIQAARLAHADQFIRHMPEGYDTRLTEAGSNLSQGQRQLLAIARAVLSDPAILVLDEATSSVDTRTEIYIQKAMLNLMKGRTSFVIAHRLSTIRGAELILVINEGRIVEQGRHEELLARHGFYHELYMSQFSRA